MSNKLQGDALSAGGVFMPEMEIQAPEMTEMEIKAQQEFEREVKELRILANSPAWQRIKEAFLKEGLTIETILLDGNPADEIISYAAANPIDLILCGTRGLGEIGSLLLGSVAHKLVTYSQVPVLVIK